MVELVVEDSRGGAAAAEHRGAYATADSHHSSIASTMLEPAPRLQGSSGFATALRDLPAFACSVQPNRSLPLRPAPPVPRCRKPAAQPVLYAATAHPKLSATGNGNLPANQNDKSRKQIKTAPDNDGKSNDEDEDDDDEQEERTCEQLSDVSEKSIEHSADQNNRHPSESPSSPRKPSEQPADSQTQSSEPEARNGVAEVVSDNDHANGSEPGGARIIEDVLVSGESTSCDAPQLEKMVPPLRLKKIATSPSPSGGESAAPIADPDTSPRQSQQQQQQTSEDTSKYCIVATETPSREEPSTVTTTTPPTTSTTTVSSSSSSSPTMLATTTSTAAAPPPAMTTFNVASVMAADQHVIDCAPKSIEITIPSIPELGIKDARTDRIDLTQDMTSSSKPFIINYILDNRSACNQYPTMVPTAIPVMTPIYVKSPNTGGPKSQPQLPPPPLVPSSQQQQQHPHQPQHSPGSYAASNLNHPKPPTALERSSEAMPKLVPDGPSSEVQILSSPGAASSASSPKSRGSVSPSERRCEWFAQRQQVRERFRELRARAIEARQKCWASLSLLEETSPQRTKLQRAIEDCDRQINHCSGLLQRLGEAVSQAKFRKFCEESQESAEALRISAPSPRQDEPHGLRIVEEPRQAESPAGKTNAAQAGIEENRKAYSSVISCSDAQNGEKPGTAAARKDSSPSPANDGDSVILKRKLQTNGYLNLPRDYEASFESRYETLTKRYMPIAPRTYVVETQQQQSVPKSVIVEPTSKTQSQPHPQQQQPQPPRTGYSSFLIDDLNAAPMQTAATVLRGTTYPLHSRDAVQGARAPPNSPREALIASSVTGAWTDQHHGHPQVSAHVTVTATDTERQQQQQQASDAARVHRTDDRRPLDLAIKGTKRMATVEDSQLAEKDDKNKKRKQEVTLWSTQTYNHSSTYKTRPVASVTREAYPTQQSAYPYAYPQEAAAGIWSPAEYMAQSRHIGEQYARSAEYARHAEYKQQSYDYAAIMDAQRIQYEKAASAEQTKAVNALKSSYQQQQQSQQQQPQRRVPGPKSEVGPIKPTAQHATAAVLVEPSRQQHPQPGQSSPLEHGKLTQRAAAEPRIMTEQFPTLGNWVAGLVKKQGAETGPQLRKDGPERGTPTDSRQTYYQAASGGSGSGYKPTSGEIANVGSSSYGANGSLPVPGRWSTTTPAPAATPEPHHQQTHQAAAARPFQPVPLPATPALHSRHQGYYAPIPPGSIALSYPAKYTMDLYQKTPVLGYSSQVPYPYAASLQAYPTRLTEATAPAGGSSSQRTPGLMDELRAQQQQQQHQQQQHQRGYYATAESTGSPRLLSAYSAADPYRRRAPSIVGLEYAAADQQPYTRLLSQVAAAGSIDRSGQGAKEAATSPTTPDLAQRVGRPYKNGTYSHAVVQNARTGSVVGQSPGSTSAIYLPAHDGSPRPASQQPQHRHQQSSPGQPSPSQVQPSAKLRPGSYEERECPTPSLGEVASRSPSNAMSALRCSNCGAPNARFACLGCESAVYCNETCQAHHWMLHVAQCPKMMPRLKKVG